MQLCTFRIAAKCTARKAAPVPHATNATVRVMQCTCIVLSQHVYLVLMLQSLCKRSKPYQCQLFDGVRSCARVKPQRVLHALCALTRQLLHVEAVH